MWSQASSSNSTITLLSSASKQGWSTQSLKRPKNYPLPITKTSSLSPKNATKSWSLVSVRCTEISSRRWLIQSQDQLWPSTWSQVSSYSINWSAWNSRQCSWRRFYLSLCFIQSWTDLYWVHPHWVFYRSQLTFIRPNRSIIWMLWSHLQFLTWTCS